MLLIFFELPSCFYTSNSNFGARCPLLLSGFELSVFSSFGMAESQAHDEAASSCGGDTTRRVIDPNIRILCKVLRDEAVVVDKNDYVLKASMNDYHNIRDLVRHLLAEVGRIPTAPQVAS